MKDEKTPHASVKRRRRGTEGLRSLADLDQRTRAAKLAQGLIANIESDLGGSERLTTGQRELVKRAALAGALAEDVEVRWLQGEAIEVAAYSMLLNTQRRLLATVGLNRIPKDIKRDITLEAVQIVRGVR